MFKNRQEAGVELSHKLSSYISSDTVILGLARGGVVVASVIAQNLSIPVDVLVVKKLSNQSDPELAIGALAPDGILYIDWKLAHRLGIDEYSVNNKFIPDVQTLIDERSVLYHRGRKHIEIKGKTIILVDDGAATGATMFAAILWVKRKKAKKIIVALPVTPKEYVGRIKRDVDAVVVLDTPHDFGAVGQYYNEFPQVSDEEVIELLKKGDNKSVGQ